MKEDKPPIGRVMSGALQGQWVGNIAAFRGIPYAAPPIGPLRFAPPTPVQKWNGVRSAERQALAPPQPNSRGEVAMGPMDVPGYDEDCLTLNVWTPAHNSRERLPVFVWFHGGGFMFGAGSASWYDGSVMARRGKVVVVTVNYRLGALGWLYFDPGELGDEAVANLGLQDQCQALQWVRDNISAFGGDPDKVTVAGQSAGSLSIVSLHAMPRAKGLFHRAILQSAPPTIPANTVDAARDITDMFCSAAGANKRDVRNLSVEAIIAAQNKTLMDVALSAKYDPRLKPSLAMCFQFVVDGETLPTNPVEAARNGSLDKSDLMIMCTPEEMRFSLAFDESWWQRDRKGVIATLEQAGGGELITLFEAYAALEPNLTPADVLCRMITDWTCTVPSIELAERRARIGKPAYFAWFTLWSKAANARLGPCHTIELPFVFNNIKEHWMKAPMLTGMDPEMLQSLADKVQDAWVCFVATGVPGQKWPAYTAPGCQAMEFGSSVQLVHNPAGPQRAFYKTNKRPEFATSTICT